MTSRALAEKGNATYAYCCTFQPGQTDDTALTNFLGTALGAVPNAAAATRFRRLFFEAHAFVTGGLEVTCRQG